MNALNIITFRYIVLLELLAINAIVTFFWAYDCQTWQEIMLQMRRTIQGSRTRPYWWQCQSVLDSFNPAVYLLDAV